MCDIREDTFIPTSLLACCSSLLFIPTSLLACSSLLLSLRLRSPHLQSSNYSNLQDTFLALPAKTDSHRKC